MVTMTTRQFEAFQHAEPITAHVHAYFQGNGRCYTRIKGLEIPVVFHWNSIDSLKAFGESLVAQANALLQEGNK